jgi:phenylpyruvate tautomerase PptA (4-oxalocrotonate tautomerase family)
MLTAAMMKLPKTRLQAVVEAQRKHLVVVVAVAQNKHRQIAVVVEEMDWESTWLWQGSMTPKTAPPNECAMGA